MEKLTSKNNEKIKLAAALCSDAGARREAGLFVLEGARLCADAAESGVKIETLFVTRRALSRPIWRRRSCCAGRVRSMPCWQCSKPFPIARIEPRPGNANLSSYNT